MAHHYYITNKSRHFSAIIYAELYIPDFLYSGEIFKACYSISPRAVRFIHSILCNYLHRVLFLELRGCAALQSSPTTTSTSLHCKLWFDACVQFIQFGSFLSLRRNPPSNVYSVEVWNTRLSSRNQPLVCVCGLSSSLKTMCLILPNLDVC